MKNIGMFYSDRSDMYKAFKEHADRSDPLLFQCEVKVSIKSNTITIGDVRWMYFSFEKDGDAMRVVGGINFDAMFSENLHPHCKRYVMTRFRPGLNK